jgi:hypothetical protein
MTCQECETKLGMGEEAGEHLASCAECRELAEELRLNSYAMRDMKVRTRTRWEWVLATAAAVVMVVAVWRGPVKEPPRNAAAANIGRPTRADQAVVVPVKHVRKRVVTEPLRVKMFTSDPDVVIYWIVDRKVGSE